MEVGTLTMWTTQSSTSVKRKPTKTLVQAYDLALVALEVQKKEKKIGNLVTYHDEFTRHI